MADHAIVQSKIERIDPDDLVEVLVQQGHLTNVDAKRVALKTQGVLWEHFQPLTAERVAQELTARGYGVRVVETGKLPIVKHPRTVRWLDIGERALGTPWTSNDATVPIPWPAVFLVSSGDVREIKSRTVMTGKRRDYRGAVHYTEEDQQYSKPIHVTDVIGLGEDKTLLHVRFAANDLAYERTLGESVEGTAFERYLQVIEAIVERSPNVLATPPTRKLLAERRQRPGLAGGTWQAGLDGLAFQRYNRWMLQLVVFQAEDRAKAGVRG